MIADGYIKQAGIQGWYTAEKMNPVCCDDFPEALHHTVATVTLRGAENHMGAAREWQQPGNQDRIDMKQW